MLLSVQDLAVRFRTEDGTVHAVNRVSFDLEAAETLAIVGESGCGKSATSLAIMGLLPRSHASIAAGRIRFAGTELVGLPESRMREIRGRDISMVFQDPMTSLNPVLTIGRQLTEALTAHKRLAKAELNARAMELLRMVGIAEPERQVERFPHQLSGGMRQRVMLAMALCLAPKLLIADEPTTALDVTIQAQVLELVAELTRRSGTAVLLITHNLGVVAAMAERVLVMYAGCPFAPRCAWRIDACWRENPVLLPADSTHGVACHNPVSASEALAGRPMRPGFAPAAAPEERARP